MLHEVVSSFILKTPKIFAFKKIGGKIIIFRARRIKIKYKFPRPASVPYQELCSSDGQGF